MRRTSKQVDAEHALHVGSGPHDGPRCHCRHDGHRWLAMCEAAAAEYNRVHADAQRAYMARGKS